MHTLNAPLPHSAATQVSLKCAGSAFANWVITAYYY
jgi:hypothetical protein